MIDPGKLAELREALEEQRENLRKEIVEQGGELHDERIRFFDLAEDDGVLPDAMDMPPIVTAAFALHEAANMVSGTCNDVCANEIAPLGCYGLQANDWNLAGRAFFIRDEIAAYSLK